MPGNRPSNAVELGALMGLNLDNVAYTTKNYVQPGNGTTVGARIWSGSGAPVTINGSSNGDLYIDMSAGTQQVSAVFYVKVSGSWLQMVAA